MVEIGANCLLRNTDLKTQLKKLIPVINLLVGSRNGHPTFRGVYKELIKQTGVELDLDSFAEMYKSEIPQELRFTSDAKIAKILNSRTKLAFDKLINGAADRIDGLGTTSTDRAALHKATQILTHIEGKDKSVRTKTMSKIIKDAVLAGIQRVANTNEAYRAAKKTNPKATFDETLEKVFETNALGTKQSIADQFNTIQDVMVQARDKILETMEGLVDEDGEPILGAEALNFLEQYKNAFFGTLMSSAQANTIIRGALIDKFGKGPETKRVMNWKKIAGEQNSPEILRETIIETLKEGKGFSQGTAESIADAVASELKDLVQGQKAMKIKYGLAEAEAKNILQKLSWPEDAARDKKVSDALRDAIDKSVLTSDTLDISSIVHDVLKDVVGVKPAALANIPKALKITSSTADRIANVVKEDGDLNPLALATLYGTLGKVVDSEVINDLRRLSELKNSIDNIEIIVDEKNNKKSASKLGLEKAKTLQAISNEMARVVARSYDYTDKSIFYKMATHALNGVSSFLSANTALVLLNPFNLTQNILSGAFVGVHGKVGGWVHETFGGKYKTPLNYRVPGTNKTIDLSSLLHMEGSLVETWWNSLLGAGGRDIPDLFSGDASKEIATIQSAKTASDKVQAAISFLPRAALTATDQAMKDPYVRQEIIRGLLFHLQASGKLTKQQAQDAVYRALTGNSPENLLRQAKQLAAMLGTGKENDKYFVKQIAEDIQISSLILFEPDGTPILTEQNLQSIINAARQTSSEAFGHVIQKDAIGFNWIFDLVTGMKAKAIEGANKQYGDRMKDLYSRGEYRDAAWLHFTHTLKTSVGFLFQRGIYNWAILMSQKNPLSVVRGFRALAKSRDTNFSDPKAGQEAVENFLRSRAKIGRGVMGTATALVTTTLVMAALRQGCDGDEDCIHEKLEALKKDPVWGRLYRNFVSPLAQTFIDVKVSQDFGSDVASGLGDILIAPVISAGSKYYSVDNVLIQTVEDLKKLKYSASGKDIGGVLSVFVPARGLFSTNQAWIKRAFGKDSPGMISKNFEIIIDYSKRPKEETFLDAFLWPDFSK